jgi:hypothetical protein
MKNKSVKMPEFLVYKIQKIADEEDRKFSAMARLLIERQIKHMESKGENDEQYK